ncbi:MAG: DUF2254 family protein [Lysobacteraceae bacterium]
MSTYRPNWIRQWLLPMAMLAGAATALFGVGYLLDHLRSGGSGASAALDHYLGFDDDKITDAISQLAPVVVALLGIVVTVVAIIVQLSSSRHSGVARMFVRDWINRVVLAFYVIAGISGVWLSVALKEGFVPQVALLTGLVTASLGMLLMLPYFAYVFWFLDPANLVLRIRADAARTVEAVIRRGGMPAARLDARQAEVLAAMAELTDIASHSVADKDKIIASRAVDALKDFALDYIARKDVLTDPWFRIGRSLAENPDFVAMDPESLADLEKHRTWVEWQILRQYLSIYGEASNSLREINYLIAIDTRYIGEMALRREDEELIRLVFRYMNSYLRATLNLRDVRTAYNVLNQYRLLAQAMLRQGQGRFALEAVRYMSYYSHVSFDLTLNFVVETVAYDLSALCQSAHELDSPVRDAMLDLFLELDRPLRLRSQERALLGVRKAQAKLAAYLLSVGDLARARIIARDMHEENAERIATIRSELERVDDKDFWEIIDRGRTFEYMPPVQRAALGDFFAMLESAPRGTGG